MNVMDAAFWFATSVLVFAGWAGFVVVAPRVGTSLFRYDLWKLRDDILGDVLDGRLPRGRATESAVALIEGVIRHARWVTRVHWRCLPDPEAVLEDTVSVEVRRALDDLPEEQKRRLTSHLHALARLVGERVGRREPGAEESLLLRIDAFARGSDAIVPPTRPLAAFQAG